MWQYFTQFWCSRKNSIRNAIIRDPVHWIGQWQVIFGKSLISEDFVRDSEQHTSLINHTCDPVGAHHSRHLRENPWHLWDDWHPGLGTSQEVEDQFVGLRRRVTECISVRLQYATNTVVVVNAGFIIRSCAKPPSGCPYNFLFFGASLPCNTRSGKILGRQFWKLCLR